MGLSFESLNLVFTITSPSVCLCSPTPETLSFCAEDKPPAFYWDRDRVVSHQLYLFGFPSNIRLLFSYFDSGCDFIMTFLYPKRLGKVADPKACGYIISHGKRGFADVMKDLELL